MQEKLQILKDRGDLAERTLDIGILSPHFQSKIKQAKSIKHICVGVTETRQELIENKIKDKWRTYDIHNNN